MTRVSPVLLTVLFAAATAVATERDSSLASERVASKRAKTAVVQVHQPTVIVFVPPRWAVDAKSDEGKFPDSAGAYLLKSGKKPRAVATPNDTAGLGDILTRAVGEFFDVPGCLS